MSKLSVGVIAFLCIVFAAPASAAPQDSSVYESVCAPISDTELEQDLPTSALDRDRQDHQTKIDLLESGINPGFTSVPEIDEPQFIESVAQFQAANDLPVTGRLDEQTLAELEDLNISHPKSDATGAAVERAKPSK